MKKFILALCFVLLFIIFFVSVISDLTSDTNQIRNDCEAGTDAAGQPCESHWIQFGPLAGSDKCDSFRSLEDLRAVYDNRCHLDNYIGHGCLVDIDTLEIIGGPYCDREALGQP